MSEGVEFDGRKPGIAEEIHRIDYTKTYPDDRALPTVDTTPLVITPDRQITGPALIMLTHLLSQSDFSLVNGQRIRHPLRYRATLIDESRPGIWQLNISSDRIVIHPDHPDHYSPPSLCRIISIVDNHLGAERVSVTNDVEGGDDR